LIASGAVASWLGMWFEVLKPGPGKGLVLWGCPVKLLLTVSFIPDQKRIEIWRLNYADRTARGVVLPDHLTVKNLGESFSPLSDFILPGQDKLLPSPNELDCLDSLRRSVGEAIGLTVDYVQLESGVVDEDHRRMKQRHIDQWLLDENLLLDADPERKTPLSVYAIAIRERLGDRSSTATADAEPTPPDWLP
jgi:hypothetical protein